VWVKAPLDECLARNALRPAARRVPEASLRRIHDTLEPPAGYGSSTSPPLGQSSETATDANAVSEGGDSAMSSSTAEVGAASVRPLTEEGAQVVVLHMADHLNTHPDPSSSSSSIDTVVSHIGNSATDSTASNLTALWVACERAANQPLVPVIADDGASAAAARSATAASVVHAADLVLRKVVARAMASAQAAVKKDEETKVQAAAATTTTNADTKEVKTGDAEVGNKVVLQSAAPSAAQTETALRTSSTTPPPAPLPQFPPPSSLPQPPSPAKKQQNSGAARSNAPAAASSRALAALLNEERKLLLLELRLGSLNLLEAIVQERNSSGNVDHDSSTYNGRKEHGSTGSRNSKSSSSGPTSGTDAEALAQQLAPKLLKRCLASLRSQASEEVGESGETSSGSPLSTHVCKACCNSLLELAKSLQSEEGSGVLGA